MADLHHHTQLYYGLSGLALPIPKYKFPPPHQESSRLTYYASLFNSIEVNSSFYKIPMPATVSKWAGSVPPEFKFTFKLFQDITHNKGLEFKSDDIARFFKAIEPAGDKKGCVLVQLPPNTGKECTGQLYALLTCVNENNAGNAWSIAVEFRNRSWYTPELYNLLDDLGAAMVIQDIPKSATPMLHQTGGFVYVRFHGPTGNYRDTYPESFLYEYATYIREWLDEGKTVYTYFNNTMGEAYNNQHTLTKFIRNA